jgi:hypothetical protein
MVRHRRFLTCLAVLLGCCALSESVPAQNIRQAVIVSPPRHGNANPFAVMGHVRNPQVFELATASPSLVELIDVFARGLTDAASKNVRIIRNGRSINTFYDEKSTTRLMPGDLVIIDGQSSRGTIFRGGQSNAESADGRVRIGIFGVLPYPLLTEINAGQTASAKSIARSLGQSDEQAELAAAQAQFIVPRRFSRTDATTQLPDCSVIIFKPSTIDTSRLPPRLPAPVRPSQAASPVGPQDAATPRPPLAGNIGAPRPLAQIPNARSLSPPGTATVPHSPSQRPPFAPHAQPVPSQATSRAPANDQPLRRDAEERVRDLLTSPSSVSVESDGNSLEAKQAPRTDALPGRVNLSDDETNDSPATKPFQSFVDQRLDNASTPEEDAPVELPLTPANDAPAGTPGSSQDDHLTVARDVQVRDDGVAAEARQAAVSDENMPFPTAIKSGAVSSSQSKSESPAQRPATDRKAPAKASNQQQSQVLDAVQKGTVSPRLLKPANWPLISALTIGGGVVLSILLMMIVVAWRKPDLPTVADPGERFWLEKIIQNELPIENEPVSLPNGEQLFGKATPIVRIDAAHSSVPKPHFLAAGGESGVRRGSAPPSADPESGSSDSPATDTDNNSGTRTPRHDDRPGRSQPMVPLRPAAKHSPVVEAATGVSTGFALDLARTPSSMVASRETETHGKTRRRAFRVDSGHRPVSPAESVTQISGIETRSVAREKQAPTTEAQQSVAQPNGRVAQSTDEIRDVSDTVESKVPRPRFLRRRSTVTADTQSATEPLPAANDQTIVPTLPVGSEQSPTARQAEKPELTNAPVENPHSEISVKPARSVAETDDLLDRVLSSMHQEKRGDQ